jgi:hypothetical protein
MTIYLHLIKKKQRIYFSYYPIRVQICTTAQYWHGDFYKS